MKLDNKQKKYYAFSVTMKARKKKGLIYNRGFIPCCKSNLFPVAKFYEKHTK